MAKPVKPQNLSEKNKRFEIPDELNPPTEKQDKKGIDRTSSQNVEQDLLNQELI